ncbi:unnamed protein product [Rodentolepis nana]|uniref:CTP_transf_like domain-containing protein n=1 Tax=Rodentolepis nana TaxID=102285 RepID=A0A0R3THX9_RODNA|nr:unnamed protein product [Rodentolepis nana]
MLSTSAPPSSILSPRRQIVVAGVISPTSDGYSKAGLASAESRCRLARLACSTSSDWIAVDSWEASQPNWTPTREVLEHLQARLTRISRQLSSEAGSSMRTNSPEGSKVDNLEDPRFGEPSDETGKNGADQRSVRRALNDTDSSTCNVAKHKLQLLFRGYSCLIIDIPE